MVSCLESKLILNGISLDRLISALREKKQKIVFTNGCFDIIHSGHIHYLQESRKLGNILIVGLNSDASIKRIKGPTRPINQESERITVLSALQMVDYITVFSEDTPIQLIDRILPDVYTKGGDYSYENMIGQGIGGDYITAYGGQAVLIPIVKSNSSSSILNKMGERP